MKTAEKFDRYSDWLDTKFKIPGTNITFGLDFLIGLFPVVGDIVSFSLSGGLVLAMVAKGASGRALFLMLFNIFLDAAIGSIPLVGDLFDLFFKANRRNLDLFQDHFEEGKHQGSAWPYLIVIGIFIVLMVVGIFYLCYRLFAYSLSIFEAMLN